MDAALVVAAIVGVFFLVGLVVGGIVVIALPLFRGRRSGRDKRREPGDRPDRREFERGGRDDRPRWPGDDGDG
jgi:hypothetical protein